MPDEKIPGGTRAISLPRKGGPASRYPWRSPPLPLIRIISFCEVTCRRPSSLRNQKLVLTSSADLPLTTTVLNHGGEPTGKDTWAALESQLGRLHAITSLLTLVLPEQSRRPLLPPSDQEHSQPVASRSSARCSQTEYARLAGAPTRSGFLLHHNRRK